MIEHWLLNKNVKSLNFLPFLDYFYYLHEPNEEQHLYMSVYPYEVPMNYFGANSGEFGSASIIYKKEEKKSRRRRMQRNFN